jgi:hypothetical protein
MSDEITLKVVFIVGTLEEAGMGDSKITWMESESGGRHFELTAGAGMGSRRLEASVHEGERCLYAVTDITALTRQLFRALEARMDAGQESAPVKFGPGPA